MAVLLEKNEFAVERSKEISRGGGGSARGRAQKVKLLFFSVFSLKIAGKIPRNAVDH